MLYLIFESLVDFDLWHGEIMKSLGLPKSGFNAATNKQEDAKQQTINYTQAYIHPTNRILGFYCAVDASCPENLTDPAAQTVYGFTLATLDELKAAGWLEEELL